jgi:hypothetical protein
VEEAQKCSISPLSWWKKPKNAPSLRSLGMSSKIPDDIAEDMNKAEREWMSKCKECQSQGHLCQEHFLDVIKRIPGVKEDVVNGKKVLRGIGFSSEYKKQVEARRQ